MSVTPAPSPCNICGARDFLPRLDQRRPRSGTPSKCGRCGSLEHQRVARTLFAALPRPLLEGSKCLRLTLDPALDSAWFSELRALGEPGVAGQVSQLAASSFDWVYVNQLITGNESERAALEELMRVVGNGFVVLVDGSPEDRADGAALAFMHGAQYGDALRGLLPDVAVLELVGLDACSLNIESVFVLSLDEQRLKPIAEAAAQSNIHARVFSPRISALRAAWRDRLPPELDELSYGKLYPDLARFSAPALRDHYVRYGQKEGRRAHTLRDRAAFAALLSPDLDVLEIGPWASPLVSGPNVRYVDLHDTATLKALASRHGFAAERVPEVHYVSPDRTLDLVEGKFDAVISSHAVGNQPDFIGHLDSVERLLRPGGLYFALIPDKNYCYDHFNATSTIAELLEAHATKRTRHTLRSHVAYAALRTHNDATRHWRGDHGAPASAAAGIASAVDVYLKRAGAYVDERAWYFDPASFRETMSLLQQLGETNFRILRLYPTLLNNNEFWVVLEVGES